MKPILQPKGSNLCGQACVASILEISLEEAVSLIGKHSLTRARDLARVLRVPPILEKVRKGKEIPSRCILSIEWDHDPKRRHWVPHLNGKIHDPLLGYDHVIHRDRIGYRVVSFLRLD